MMGIMIPVCVRYLDLAWYLIKGTWILHGTWSKVLGSCMVLDQRYLDIRSFNINNWYEISKRGNPNQFCHKNSNFLIKTVIC